MILSFGDSVMREKCVFKNRPVRIRMESGEIVPYPCIALYEMETDVPLGYPAYERWYLRLAESEQMRTATIRKKAFHICSFLNYLLWNTARNDVSEVTVDDIRGFLLYFRETSDGDERSPEDWHRCVGDVYDFLSCYKECNENSLEFGYDSSRLFRSETVMEDGSRRKIVIRSKNMFSVKPPVKTERKNRLLAQGYLEMVLFECRKHEPMIALGVALQAFAGLREGEVVNLTRSSLKIRYGGFGSIGRITADVSVQAPFSSDADRKTAFGNIKIPRKQDVYVDFIPKVMDFYSEHESLLLSMEASCEPDAPLFVNRHGKPMSVDTYTAAVRSVFMNRFVPDLKKLCITDGSWAENAPFIEAYEREYPGAHMFRHWFTMYLLQNTPLSRDEISHWRGDSSPESMNDYVHVNAGMIRLFTGSVFRFQKSVLEEVL